MAEKKVILNPRTLNYEEIEVRSYGYLRVIAVVVTAVVLFILYLWIYAGRLGGEMPKTAVLRKQNADWLAAAGALNARLGEYDRTLEALRGRDDKIYRSIFGMDEIPSAVRTGSLAGRRRYDAIEPYALRLLSARADAMLNKAYVQSKSYDELEKVADRIEDMASCIPAIAPLNTDPKTYRMSSPFGYRSDPIYGFVKGHTGMDFACPPGNPVHATGDGVVEAVHSQFFGYGNIVVIDHGFGYKTRYAHLSRVVAVEGQKVRRGEVVAYTGNSGRTTGPHLHYEVVFRKDFVNPAAYMDLTLSPEEYAALTTLDK